MRSRPASGSPRAREDELFAVGFSRRKAEYVVGLARSDLDLDALALPRRRRRPRSDRRACAGSAPGPRSGSSRVTSRRPRAWPAGDLALRKAVEVLYGVGVEELGPRLEPFQNLSAHYLLTGARSP